MSEERAADPAHTMALLWGTKEPPSRGPKPTLTVEQVTRAAIEMADAEGLDALSMRRLAERLGVGTMSLYRYVPAKSELIDLMNDAVLVELDIRTGNGWRSTLESYAREGLELARRHPWTLRVPYTRGLMGPHQMAVMEIVHHAVSELRLSAGEIVHVVSLVAGYVRGAARAAAEAAHLEQRTGVSDEQWWSEHAALVTSYTDPERFPTLTAIYVTGEIEAEEDAFEFGLQRVLDGIEAFIRA